MRDALYQSARLYLGQHYADASLSPAILAAHLNLAPRTLQALFQEHGTTVTESLLSLRLQAAERLLSRERHLLVADIAYHVGFSDLSYFNRAFRRRFGMTPRECRSAE
jgi:AraC-like DNA-binding protein